MPDNYIICSTQRSGSSFFCECLKQTRFLGTPAEWLVFLEYDVETLDPRETELRSQMLAEVIRQRSAEQRALSQAEVTGWKIMWSTMIKMREKLRYEQDQRLDADVLARMFGQPRYIFYERQNKLAQAISHVIMSKTKISHVWSQAELEHVEAKKQALQITNEEITWFLRKLLREEREWLQFFDDNGIMPLKLVYEDFCDDIAGGIRAAAEFLGAPLNPEAFASGREAVMLKKTRSGFEHGLSLRYLDDLIGRAAHLFVG